MPHFEPQQRSIRTRGGVFHLSQFIRIVSLLSCAMFWSSTDPIYAQQIPDYPVGLVPRSALSADKSFDYDFDNISAPTLQRWLDRVGVELPVELDGALSGWVWVERDQSWFDVAGFRVEAAITSPLLNISDWKVEEAQLRLGYVNGTWYVGSLSGTVRSPIDAALIGQFNSNAKISTGEDAVSEVDVNIGQVRLKPLLTALGVDADVDNDNGTLTLNATIPMSTAQEVGTWTATGDVSITKFTSNFIQSPGNTSAALSLSEGTWEINKGLIDVALQKVNFSGTGQLTNELTYRLNVDADAINAAELLQQIGQPELAAKLSGFATLNASVAGDQTTGITSAVAQVDSKTLTLLDQAVSDLIASAEYTATGTKVEIETATLAGGTVKGALAWTAWDEIVEGLPRTANLTINGVELSQLQILKEYGVRGITTGKINIQTITAKQDDTQTISQQTDDQSREYDWTGSGDLKINTLAIGETNFGQTRLEFRRRDAKSDLTADVEVANGSGSVKANVSAKLSLNRGKGGVRLRGTEIESYSASGNLNNYDLVARIDNGGRTVIPARVQGSFSVRGSQTNWLGSGAANLSDSVLKISDRRLRIELAELTFNADEFRVSELRLLDAAGRVSGAGIIQRQNAGDHLLRLRISNLELGHYFSTFATTLPVALRTLNATAAIDIELTKPAFETALTDRWKGNWDGALTKLTLKGQSLGELSTVGSIDEEGLQTRLKGKLLGGSLDATLQLPKSQRDKKTQPPFRFLATASDLEIRKLVAALTNPTQGKRFVGRLSTKIAASDSATESIEIDAELKLPRLVHDQKVLARDLTAKLKWKDDIVSIERAAGGLAGGVFEARGRLKLSNDDGVKLVGGHLNLAARQLNAHRIVKAITPQYAGYYAGEVSYRGSAHYRRGIELSGSAKVKDGSLFGLPIQLGRGNVRASFSADGAFKRIVSNDLHGTALGGHFEAGLKITGGSNFTLATNGRIVRGHMEQLSRGLGFEQIAGAGQFDGRFDIESSRIESIDALLGSLEMQFNNGDVKSIPLLSSLNRFVPLTQFASTDIESGSLHAQLGQGQLRISDAMLNSKAFVIAANGTASLDGFGLDLNAVMQTGGGVEQRITQNVLNRLILGSIPQVALISQVNELVRNRTIFVHIGGSPGRPVIQAKPGKILLRAFLQNFSRGVTGDIPVIGN